MSRISCSKELGAAAGPGSGVPRAPVRAVASWSRVLAAWHHRTRCGRGSRGQGQVHRRPSLPVSPVIRFSWLVLSGRSVSRTSKRSVWRFSTNRLPGWGRVPGRLKLRCQGVPEHAARLQRARPRGQVAQQGQIHRQALGDSQAPGTLQALGWGGCPM